MRVYEVRLKAQRRFAANQTEGSQLKRQLLEVAGLGLRSNEATVTEIEVPTIKAELLAWVNGVLREQESAHSEHPAAPVARVLP